MHSGWGPLFTNMPLIVYTADPELCEGQRAVEADGVRKPALPSSWEGCDVLTRVHLAPPASSCSSPFPPTSHSFQSHFFPTCHRHGLCHSLEFMALHSHPYRHQSAPQLRAAAGYADSRLGTGEPRLNPGGLSLPSKSTPSLLNWGVCEVLWEPRGSALDFAKRETKASVVPIKSSINCNQT